MWLQCGLAVPCTHTASEYGSQNALNTHTRVHGKGCLCVKHISTTRTVIQTPHIHRLTRTQSQNVEGLKKHRFKNTHKKMHIHLQIGTHKAAGILWLNLFMLEILEKIVLKAAHHFCMRGDDWNCSASLFISVSSLFGFYLLSISVFHTGLLPTWTLASVHLSPFYFTSFYSLAILTNESLNLRGSVRSMRETGRTNAHIQTCHAIQILHA